MEELKILVLVGGFFLSVPVCFKAFMELLVIPRANMRSEYNFVLEVAKHTNDNHVILYAKELGYKVLVNDNKLTTVQRKAMLSLPDRANLIPKYLVVKNLLVVQNCSPILKWKTRRHENALYRKSLISILSVLYFMFSLLGLFSLANRYLIGLNGLPDLVTKLSAVSAIISISIGVVAMFHAIKLDAASDLVKVAGHLHDAEEQS